VPDASTSTSAIAEPATRAVAPLDRLFHARSIALVGLSADPRKATGAPLAILRQAGFAGSIHPVNPRYPEIDGLRCHPAIDALPEACDVALIMLSARLVPDAIRACGRRGIPVAVVLSSGFEESEEGRAHAADLARAARETGVRVIGPNCEGVWSVRERVLLTFGSAARRSVLHHAPIAVLSQSGAMAGALARHLQDSGVGCAYVVSVGNETVLTIADYLEWVMEQPDVRVVVLFVEGLRDGARLLRLVERARTKGIRVVALKSGNSTAGQQAAASHTGKIASPYAVYHALFAEAGVVQVDSLTELIEAAEVLAVAPPPPRRGTQGGVAVFSIPGGTRALTADHLELQGVPLAIFARGTVAALSHALPEFGGTENPTDLTGQVLSHPGLFDQCLRIIADDPNSEALIVQVANRGPHDVMQRADLLGEVARASAIPVIVTFLGDALPAPDRARLREAGVVCARDPAEAARYLGWLYRTRESVVARERPPGAVASTAMSERWDVIVGFLRACGIAVPAQRTVEPDADVAALAHGLRWPVVAKALPEDCEHKTEQGAVILRIRSAAELAEAVDTIRARLGRADLRVLVQEMVGDGIEVLLSAVRNADFGPVLALGSGGIAVELFRDVTYVALPTDPGRVLRALRTLKAWQLLQGFRGAPRADVAALVAAAVAFGNGFAAAAAEVAELELNPLFVRPEGHGVVAVDALVRRT